MANGLCHNKNGHWLDFIPRYWRMSTVFTGGRIEIKIDNDDNKMINSYNVDRS